ncbi:hypothetical protein N431DRAFT_380216 [Stipitochalara longipes BDJ]|nr:hypothetical protein N431DRAFT_380216 [Stipitochalara longipes BDJ]
MAEQTLKELWDEAEARFKLTTGKSLKLSPPKTLEDVRKEFEAQQIGDIGKEDAKGHVAKDFSLIALQCLKLLGGVAAQGAALVFGPADLCFNAISMLLDIPSNIHEFHEAVDGMFEEVSIFLSQFKIYSRIEAFSSIDPELMRLIHKLMISFVDICALSITLRKSGRWRSFKGNFKKVILNDDSGVQTELKRFKALVDTHSSIQGTITLEAVLHSQNDLTKILFAASDSKESITALAKKFDHVADRVDHYGEAIIEVLNTAEGTKKSEQTAKENQKIIRDKLLGSTDVAQKSATTCNDCWVASMKNSGEWIDNVPKYQDWVDRKPEADPLLLITGDPNTGKSFLSSVIVHRLQSSQTSGPQTSTRTPLVAYHFFSKKTEKSPQNPPPPAQMALKCLAAQIAARDPAYEKKVLELCRSSLWADESLFKDLSCKELWQSLNFVDPKRDLTYFIVLDGLDQLPGESSGQLLEILSGLKTSMASLADPDRCQLRVVATGTLDTFPKDQFEGIPRVHIPEFNISDIQHFVDHELKEKDLLQGKDPETARLRNSIRDTLPGRVEGDFFKVRTAIVKINDLVNSDGSATQVMSILNEAGQSREEIAVNVVKAANQALSAKEIDEVNEMLIWAIHGAQYFKVDKMQGALYLRFGTVPLQPLEKKLKKKYNKLFEYENELIQVGEEIENAVTTTANTRIKAADIPQITATITITSANMSQAQNFLWDLAEHGAMKKFLFDENAAKKTSKGTIRVNQFDAHLWIVNQSLELLSSPPDERTRALAAYILEWFPYHLHCLREHKNFEGLDVEEKHKIGQGVYAYIGDEDILEKFWGAYGPPETNWIDEPEDLVSLWKWLEDEEATRFLGKKDKLSLKQIKQDLNPDRSLLLPIITMLSRHWLMDRVWDVRGPFEWIKSFLQMDIQKKSESQKVEAVEKPRNENQIPVQGEEPTQEEKPKEEELTKEEKPTNEEERTPEKELSQGAMIQPENKASADDNSSHLEDEVSDQDAVAVAAKWVQKLHKISTLDSLWHERLGETYRILDLFDDAVKILTQATKLENPSWNCFRNLALALASRDNEGDLALAITEMERVLDTLRRMQSTPENKEDTKSNLIINLKQMARWQIFLPIPNRQKSQACYEEILQIDPDDLEANYWTLDTLRQPGREDQFRGTLEGLSKRKSNDSELTILGDLLIYLATVEDRNTIFEVMFLITQKTSVFEVLLENLEDALELARKETRIDELPALLLQTGIALYHFDQRDQKNPESALALWTECGALSSGSSSWGFQELCRRAYRLISFHYYHRAIASKDPSPHVEMLKQILSRHQIIDQWANAYLGYYYASIGDSASAKSLFLNDFMTALTLLSDEFEWNDWQGYQYLADILMHSGDYLNALSAWSLVLPSDIDLPAMVLDEWKDEPLKSIAKDLKELIPAGVQTASTARETFLRMIEFLDRQIAEMGDQETRELNDYLLEDALCLARIRLREKLPEPLDGKPRQGNLDLSCDGKCGLQWSYADDLYSCKSCPDVQFCKDCRDKLKAGKLQMFICSADHDWLHVPKWDDEEYAKVGRGKVKIGGTWDGERRIGGETVSIEAWLDLLKDQWGVAKTTATETAAVSMNNDTNLLVLADGVS